MQAENSKLSFIRVPKRNRASALALHGADEYLEFVKVISEKFLKLLA
jgi:hypothetical protein